jgi:hypothetical protein
VLARHFCYDYGMLPNRITYNIRRYSAAAGVIVLLGAAGLYAAHRHPTSSSQGTPAPTSQSNAGVLPDIPAPAGWDAQRMDPSRIVFTRRDDTLPLHARIDVEAFKSRSNIVDEIKSLGEDHTFDSLKTWNSEDGRLILGTPQKEGEGEGSVFTYYVLAQKQVYVFTFIPYRFYDPDHKAWTTPDPSSLPVIRQMVEAFSVNAE